MSPTPDRILADLRTELAELQHKLDERTAERDEALQRETATAEVLQVINSSPGDLAPVFDAMLEKAMRLCEAAFGGLWTFDGDRYVSTALRGVPTAFAEFLAETTVIPGPGSAPYRFLRGERSVLQNVDLADEEIYRAGDPQRRALVDLGGARTALHVPLCRDDVVLGVITIYRKEVRPFSDKPIALLQNFAAQAVIAMENARLLGELRTRTDDLEESLEYQTATSDVLEVISRSTFDLQPVLDTLVATAARLCNSYSSALTIREGDVFRYAATHSAAPELDAFLRQRTFTVGRGTTTGRVMLEGKIVHIPDVTIDPEYDLPEITTIGNIRTTLSVPLLRNGAVIGTLNLSHERVEPFTERQIELVRTFADQAVIALENARLIAETREALEQQTATAEVLQVINSSPGDLVPVFDAMLEKATRLCDAAFGVFFTYDGEHLRTAAIRGATAAYTEFLTNNPHRPGQNDIHSRLIGGESYVQFADVVDSTGYRAGDPMPHAFVELGGGRTVLAVSLRKDDLFLGEFAVYRREVRPFTDKQIALLENFAAQAVIAMENARLITETREALEQQTATAEVLGVINSSPGDLAPVFDATLDKAMHLCDAAFGLLMRYDGEVFRPAAHRGLPPRFAEYVDAEASGGFKGAHMPLVDGAPIVHLLDVAADPETYQAISTRRALVDLGGARTVLLAPLRKDGVLLGSFSIYRQEVRAFTDKQIALLQNFAAQAVIAMENARLITETREALEQQTATAEVLQVINSSPGDLAPVFDAMLEKAMQLCQARFGELRTYDGARFQTAATRGVPASYAEYRGSHASVGQPGGISARILEGEEIVQILDLKDEEAYRAGHPNRRALVELGGARTALLVALSQGATLLGCIIIYRQEVRPFSEKQIALLQNFAAQAVIAIENARLITETREALEQQTATAEVLGVINASPGDLAPVFDAILEKANYLCETVFGVLWTFDGTHFFPGAIHGPQAFIDAIKDRPRAPIGGGTLYRHAAGEQLVHIEDMAAETGVYETNSTRRVFVDLGGGRSALSVALSKDDRLLGAIQVYRQEVRPFSEKQVALLQNFAAQAVIAMENARLMTETREALEQQTATAEVLQVINSSPGDLAPVFEAMLEKATTLCDAHSGFLWTYDGERYQAAATLGLPRSFEEFVRDPRVPGPDTGIARLAAGEALVHFTDLAATGPYQSGDALHRASVDLGGFRTILVAPLRKDGVLLGGFTIDRQEVRPFTDKQVALLQNFAAQAVIAMENARLIIETQDALEQQTATAEVLQVINASPGDLAPVFDAMLEKATRLCGVTIGSLEIWDGVRARALATCGVSGAFDEVLRRGFEPGPNDPLRQLLDGARFVHIPDQAAVDEPTHRKAVELDGIRTFLCVALRKDSTLLGRIVAARTEVRPFSEKEIALLENFAAQAVIAMENARLITETREARDDAEAALHGLKAAQANLIQAEKMASLGQLTAGIAHEIKNPLNFVNNFAGLSVELLDELKETTGPALAALDADKRAEFDDTMAMLTGNLEKIAEHGRRADNIVKSMLEHSRGVSGERRAVDVNGLIDEALNLAYHGARAQDQGFNITLERDYAASFPQIELAPQEMTRVFLNLFGNGFYAATKRARENGGGSFRPVLTVATRDLGEAIEVKVRDNGTGIAPEIRDKLFHPFFTTKPTGEGTGLGLSISYDIVTQQHGGTITVESEPGSYTEFTVRLPRQ
jgi:GAF domain-containing protein